MSHTNVLVLAPDSALCEECAEMLSRIQPGKYSLFWCPLNEFPYTDSDVAIVHEEYSKPEYLNILETASAMLHPRPVIYLVDEPIPVQFVVFLKSKKSDFLRRKLLAPAGLNNGIRYAIKLAKLKVNLANEKRRYQSLFDNAVEPAFFLDARWNIVNANRAFFELFKLDDIDKHVVNFATLVTKESDFENLKKSLPSNTQYFTTESQFRFRRIGTQSQFLGKLVISSIVEATLVNGRIDYRFNGFQGTLSNVSYKKKMVQIQREVERVENTYRLARTLAHEIRNPLTNIGLSLEQLKDTVVLGEDNLNYIEIAERCTKRINELLTKLLHSSERLEFQAVETNFNDLVEAVVKIEQDRAHLHGAKLILDIGSDAQCNFCQPERLKIAITNLIANAIESTEKGKGAVIVGTYVDDTFYCIYVEDNGHGMDEEVQERLFDPFFTRKSNGVGLGLTSTQTIIAEHNGQIEVESAVGVGSTFTISLPTSQNS